MAVRSSSQENPAFHGGCWRKPNSPPAKGRGHILNEGTQVLMRNLAKALWLLLSFQVLGGSDQMGEG